MSKVYNIAFRMGVLFNILLWTFLNVISFKLAENDYIRRQIEWDKFETHLSGGGPSLGAWGIPFDWNGKYSIIESAGAIANIVIMATCGFLFGFLFKFIWLKISSRRVELK